VELPDKARLPNAGLADKREQPRPPAFDRAAQLLLNPGELSLTADERQLEPSSAARASVGDYPHELATHDPTFLALGLDCRRLRELKCVSDERDCPLPDEHLTRPGGLLEPGRHVDRVAGHERAPLARPPDDDLASVHPNPQPQPLAEQLS